MVVHLRDHSETQGGEELEVCEVAWTGWNPKTIEQLKALYAQLLEKFKPAYRIEMRFDRVDDAYEVKGKKRKFLFTESDANPFFGRMSDRTSSRWGMRRPWMLLGLLGGSLGILVVALAPSVPVVLVGWCIAQLLFNAVLLTAP